MLAKMIFIVLVLTITGLKAEVANNKLVKSFLDYSTQASSATKTSASVAALFDLIKQLSDLLEKNMKALDIESLQKTTPMFANSINNQLTYDKVQQPVLEEKSQLLTPALEVNNLFNAISDELLVKLTLYFEDLQSKVEKNALAVSKKLESLTLDLNARLITSTGSVQLSLNLQNLESTILANLEELRVNLNTYSDRVTEKLGQQSLLFVRNLSGYRVDMQESLRKTFEGICVQIKNVVEQMQITFVVKASQLKEKVSLFKTSVIGKTYLDASDAMKTTYACLTDMSLKTLLLKEAVTLYGEILKKALIGGLEDMKKMMLDSARILDKNIPEKISASLTLPFS
ncbi:uncharacterized protein [Pyxicephalus adspersus]|uniref:uncharacterized protein n=1 Tax=Pyxicephalus adspersus TaxID=30357 RepID=UPI003B59F0AF